MKIFGTLLLALLGTTHAWAVNKCKTPDGRLVYQDAPCAVSDQGQNVRIQQSNGTTRDNSAGQLPFKIAEITPEEARTKANGDMAIAKAALKDPDSAKFNGIKVLSIQALGKPIVMTCGELNAKNSFGGYVGSKRFWVYNGIFTETWNHYLPGSKAEWLMGDVQNACFKDGVSTS